MFFYLNLEAAASKISGKILGNIFYDSMCISWCKKGTINICDNVVLYLAIWWDMFCLKFHANEYPVLW